MLRTSLALLLACIAPLAMAAEPSQFARTTIDIGTVVTDLDAAVRFYTEGVGFEELNGFQIPPVNWGINSAFKRALFDLVAKVTGYPGEA